MVGFLSHSEARDLEPPDQLPSRATAKKNRISSNRCIGRKLTWVCVYWKKYSVNNCFRFQLRQTNSETDLFHARRRKSDGRRASTIDYDQGKKCNKATDIQLYIMSSVHCTVDRNGVFNARNSRKETEGARPIRENRRTKTELPVDQRKATTVQVHGA